MRKLLLLPCLMLAACTSWPDRGPDYWAKYCEEHPPGMVDKYPPDTLDEEFFPEGEVDRSVYLEDGAPFDFKLVETVNGAHLWIIEVRKDRTGFFIFPERMQDGSVIRARERKVDFALSPEEYNKVRATIIDSGFLSVRSDFAGNEESDWSVGLRTPDGLKVVSFNGGYPNEARKIVWGVFDIVVKPRSAEMAEAPVFKPEDWKTAPENQPMR